MIPPGTNRWFDPEEELGLQASWGEGLGCTTESSEAQEPVKGAPPIRLIGTWFQILGLPLSGRRGT
jgi:hypothetical protein